MSASDKKLEDLTVDEERIFTCADLAKLNPEFKDEIEHLSNTMACGCSGCVWYALMGKYGDKIKGPDKLVIFC